MLAVALTLAVQGVPTKAQKHVVTEMHDIDNVLQALLGDMKLERASALAEKNVAVEMLTLDQFKAKVRASETDPVPTDADLQARFDAVDTNHDGKITKEEYLEAVRTHALWELTSSGGEEETDLFDEGTPLSVEAVAEAMRAESYAYARDPRQTGPFPVAALDDAAYGVVMAFVAEVKAGAATQDPPYDQLVFWSGLYEKQGVAAQQLFHATHGAGRTRGVGKEYTTVETAGVGKYFTETLGFGSPPDLKAEISRRVEEALSVTLEDAQLNVAFKSMWDAFSIDFAARLGNGNQNLPVNVFLRWAPGFQNQDLSKDAAARQIIDPTPPVEADYFSEMAALRSKTFGNFEGPIVLAALYERKIEVVNIHFIDDDGKLLHMHPFTLLNTAHSDWYDDRRYEWLNESPNNIKSQLGAGFDVPYENAGTFPATIFGSAGQFNLVKYSLGHEIFNVLKWRLATKPLNFVVPAPHALTEEEVSVIAV